MFGLALLFVYMFFLSFLAFWSPYLGKRELVFVFIVHLFVSYAHVNLCHFFSSSWCQGLAATSACGSSLTFLFTVLIWRVPGSNPWPQVSRSGHSTNWASGAGTPLVCTWRYCTCMCKLLMCRCSRRVQMLHNVKKNNADLFEVHLHVCSFQIHVHEQLQIILKCTDR